MENLSIPEPLADDLAEAISALLHLRSPHATMYEGKAKAIEDNARAALKNYYDEKDKFYSAL